jgi:HD-GYP domain-containing protein (c-di-GMP phosphodiesterase class II)
VNSILARASGTDDKLVDLASEIDTFCAYTPGHGRRVAALAGDLARAFNLASQDLFFLDQAALVRDIGERQMGREYITAARILTANERFDLQRHPVIGEQEAAKVGLPRGVQLIVRWHHEWWNGSGYPDRIEGEQIPLTARILRIADTFAALLSPRPYRPAMSEDEARSFLTEWAGIEFDPDVARALLYLPRDRQDEAVQTQPEPAEQPLAAY